MDETRWLDDAQRTAWQRFAAVLELLPAAVDAQLEHDEQLNHVDYYSLAMLSEAPERTLRTTELAAQTNSTLPRLSRVINRLAAAGYVRREPCPGDRRATNLVLTDVGWDKVVHAAPGHVGNVRALVVDALSDKQLAQLSEISIQLLTVLDPSGRISAQQRQEP